MTFTTVALGADEVFAIDGLRYHQLGVLKADVRGLFHNVDNIVAAILKAGAIGSCIPIVPAPAWVRNRLFGC